MTPAKRLLDLCVLLLITPLILPIGLIITAAILILDGRPVIFRQERMKTQTQAFYLWKFRTMVNDPDDAGVSGGDKDARVTRVGRFLRRTKFDELPQAVNVLRGDVSLVGPRPPLRRYVEDYPEIYGEVLKSRPGLTGIASYFFSRHEGWLLARCKTAAETDAVYRRRCIPRKARLDLIYQRNQSVCLDFWIFWWTTARILRLPGGRPLKVRYR
ncbi:Undecaprenyl-phosphate galactosephosphotransferase [Candidatus Rhodobacter oscarellae]|uniref:Undecaprenyl-phosphate galactosephosphotransferase n=1 Tax=Candidatus Rhodobacter oscarellae TaxID=1675527 RepID=A0A0J9E650_9RHOB|nr:sugar transferase [Candidatus Rhodobacter lobularis]KMW58116.1 Undecaprenyl-phosphate galactosephosphotransferase [Candidatus Rhodobacter lobularis]